MRMRVRQWAWSVAYALALNLSVGVSSSIANNCPYQYLGTCNDLFVGWYCVQGCYCYTNSYCYSVANPACGWPLPEGTSTCCEQRYTLAGSISYDGWCYEICDQIVNRDCGTPA